MESTSKSRPNRRELLIIGGDSKIGAHLKRYFTGQGYSVSSTTRKNPDPGSFLPEYHLDLSNENLQLPSNDFESAIFCAGITKISYCEEYPEKSQQINVQNTIRVIQNLVERNTHVVFLSSNLVFDGSKQFFSHEEELSPRSKYGAYKAMVESYLKSLDFSVLRLTKVLTNDSNFLIEWENSVRRGEEFAAYTNRFVSPVEIDRVVEAINQVINIGLNKSRVGGKGQKSQQLFQLGANYEISYFDFALKYFEKNAKALSLLSGKIDESVINNRYNSLITHLPTAK